MFHHYKEAQKLLWPEDDHHRWSDLMLSEILKNKHTCIIGPKDSGKTYCALARFGLTDYFMFPEITLILISSTDVRGLELRVWGALKDLWKRARTRYDFLPGKPLESKHAICTDALDEESDMVRDMRKGIICIPCRSTSGAWLGINNYVGIKQKRRRLLSDEVQFMANQFLDAPASLDGADFKGVYVGHPLGQSDPLDKLAEPKMGWGSEGEVTKTTVWANKFNGGVTVNLVGTDSPNFDLPSDGTTKYSYLVNQTMIEDTVAFYGMDSTQYWTKCLGIRKPGLMARRVITIKLCQDFGAFEDVVWLGTPLTKIYAIDAAYGAIGGDRCIGGYAEFGEDVERNMVLALHPPQIIPVSVRFDKQPEYQIASYVMNECSKLGIPPENVFFDSTGRGSLGSAFAVTWSELVNPVEFGGSATDRPVSVDCYIVDPDTKMKRLKLCSEEFSKRVTEFWFMVRYCIESRQMRQLPRDVADEGCQREWKTVSGGRTEIETKEEMKERTGRSPDLFDWLVVILEGARRLGFQIKKLGVATQSESDKDFFDAEAEKWRGAIKSKLLQHK